MFWHLSYHIGYEIAFKYHIDLGNIQLNYRISRPVLTGCNSNTRGMSNCVSDLLESVKKANQDPYEVISGEDMLAQTEN